MPDHLHAVASFPVTSSMTRFVRKLKIYTAKKAGILWQRDFFDHRLRDAQEVDFKLRYTRENPVRAGLCEFAEDWQFCWQPDND